LQRLEVEAPETNAKNATDDDDMDKVMQEVEADKEMRLNMNIYKSDAIIALTGNAYLHLLLDFNHFLSLDNPPEKTVQRK
jgi:hypothetical protein